MFSYLIQRKKQTIFVIVLFFIAATLFLTFIQPLKYRSRSKLLVIQDFPQGVDPYTVSKANMYISTLLAQIVNSNSFYNEVINSGFNIDRNYFLKKGFFGSYESKVWESSVEARAIDDTGIIEVFTYHTDRYQNEQLAEAVNYVLKTRHQFYHGTGEKVTIKVINEPAYSTFPVKPNILLNLSLSLVFGFIFSLAYIYMLPDERYDIRIFPGRKRPIDEMERYHEPVSYRPYYSADPVDRFKEDLDKFNRNRVDEPERIIHAADPRKPVYPAAERQDMQNFDQKHNLPDVGEAADDKRYTDDRGNRISFKGNMKNVIG